MPAHKFQNAKIRKYFIIYDDNLILFRIEVREIKFAMNQKDITREVILYKKSQTFGAKDRAMLTAGATERDREAGKTALDVHVDRLSDESLSVIQEIVDSGLILQEVDDRDVAAGIGTILGVAAWVGERAAIEDKAAPIAGGIGRKALFEAEAVDGDGESVGRERREERGNRGKRVCREGGDMVEHIGEMGERDRERVIVEEDAEVGDGERDTFEERILAFEKAAEAVGAKSLHNASKGVGIEQLFELLYIDDAATQTEVGSGQLSDIDIEESATDSIGEVALGAIEETGSIVLSGATTTALVIDIKRSEPAVILWDKHNIARLEIAIHKIVAMSREEIVDKTVEIAFEKLLIERDMSNFKEIILKILNKHKLFIFFIVFLFKLKVCKF